MAEIRAAGFVLYRSGTERFLYLLLHNPRHGEFGLPKGKADASEETLATALRETEEETGIGEDRLRVNSWFETAIRYPVAKGAKEVVYRTARTEVEEVRLSVEHDRAEWLDYDAARAALRHENLRGVLDAAATFLKDPILRRGLTPPQARAVLERHTPSETSLHAHTSEVAAMARTMAEAWGGLDPDYVEAAAWLHDIGRARTHGARHTLEGFRLVVEEGLPGYAPPCLSHYTKGRSAAHIGGDPGLLEEMWRTCDLDTFPVEEQLIALADFLAVQDRRGRLEERHADLCRRYGPSRFFDRSMAIAEDLKTTFETRTRQPLYPLLGIH